MENKSVESKFFKKIYQRAKVLDSQEICNILRAEHTSQLSQLSVSQKGPSSIKLFAEQQECKRMAEEKDRTVLQRCRVTLMYKASQFYHDRTTLLITNNPLQTTDDPMTTDSPAKYLHPQTLPPVQSVASHGTSSCKQPPLKRPGTSHSTREEKAKTGGAMPSDTISTFSHEKYETRTNRCGAQLGHLDLSTDRDSLSKEPLTISSLMDPNPNTTTMTVSGQGAFRHGQTTFWTVDSSWETL